MKTLKRGFTLVELMIVVAIIGILAAIAIPNFVRFQARSKQAEAKADLKAIFTGQKAFYADHDAYSTLTGDIGFAPERGNRYAYSLVNTNPLTAAIAEDRTTATATPATTTSNGFSVDTFRYPGEATYPTINAVGIGAVTWDRVASGTADPPSYIGGRGGTCPLCTFEASAVGNIDGETAGLDVQVVSSEFINVAAAVCSEAQTHVTPGAAAIVYNDVNCGN